jgi:hypothetical protein
MKEMMAKAREEKEQQENKNQEERSKGDFKYSVEEVKEGQQFKEELNELN